MCGIVAVLALNSTGIGFKEREIFQDMLIADSLRGKDGTGTMIVDEDHNVRTLRNASHPFDLLADKKWDNFIHPPYDAKKPSDLLLVGHNRWASGGYAIDIKNSHPHRAGNITLVHNGTLQRHSRLPTINTASVDSLALAEGIAELGIDEAIARTYGAYAIIYFDRGEGTINFLRNKDRPLFYAVHAETRRVFVASEGNMLKWILIRRGITVDTIGFLKEDTLMSFEVTPDYKKAPIHSVRPVAGPKVYSYYTGRSMQDEIADELEPVVRRHLQSVNTKFSKEEKKKETRILKNLKKQGVEANVVQYFYNRTIGDQLPIKIVDWTDSAQPDSFYLIGENPLYPECQFRFQVNGITKVDEIMEDPNRMARVCRIMKFPITANPEYQFSVWVVDQGALPDPNKELKVNMAQVTKINTEVTEEECGTGECSTAMVKDIRRIEVDADSGLDIANPGHPAHKADGWKSALDDKPNAKENIVTRSLAEAYGITEGVVNPASLH